MTAPNENKYADLATHSEMLRQSAFKRARSDAERTTAMRAHWQRLVDAAAQCGLRNMAAEAALSEKQITPYIPPKNWPPT